MNDIWMISQQAILIINSVTVPTTNKPSFHSPISYLQGGRGRRVSVRLIWRNMMLFLKSKYYHPLNFEGEAMVIV